MFLVDVQPHSKGSNELHYFQALTSKFYLLFFVIHSSFISFFYFTDLKILAYLNIASALSYVASYGLNRYGFCNAAFLVMTLEVLVHASFCSEFLGDAGFSDALLFLPVLFFINPAKFRTKILYFIVIIISYIALRYNDQFHTPLYEIDEDILKSMAVGTSILIIIIDCYIAYFAYSIIQSHSDRERDGKAGQE